MLISRIKSLQLSVDVLKMVDDFYVLHNFLGAIEVAIDGEWRVRVMECVVDEMWLVLQQFLPSLL